MESIDAHEVGAPARLVARGLLRSAGGRVSGFLARRRGRRRVSDPSAAAIVLASHSAHSVLWRLRPIAKGLSENKRSIRHCEQSETIRLGRRICGSVWIASLSLAMTISSIPLFTDDCRLSVSGSGARFLPRFVTFQGLAARKSFPPVLSQKSRPPGMVRTRRPTDADRRIRGSQ